MFIVQHYFWTDKIGQSSSSEKYRYQFASSKSVIILLKMAINIQLLLIKSITDRISLLSILWELWKYFVAHKIYSWSNNKSQTSTAWHHNSIARHSLEIFYKYFGYWIISRRIDVFTLHMFGVYVERVSISLWRCIHLLWRLYKWVVYSQSLHFDIFWEN